MIQLERMRNACADILIDHLVKLREGRYGALSRTEVRSRCSMLELLLSRMDVHVGDPFRVQQENAETYERQPEPGDLLRAPRIEQDSPTPREVWDGMLAIGVISDEATHSQCLTAQEMIEAVSRTPSEPKVVKAARGFLGELQRVLGERWHEGPLLARRQIMALRDAVEDQGPASDPDEGDGVEAHFVSLYGKRPGPDSPNIGFKAQAMYDDRFGVFMLGVRYEAGQRDSYLDQARREGAEAAAVYVARRRGVFADETIPLVRDAIAHALKGGSS